MKKKTALSILVFVQWNALSAQVVHEQPLRLSRVSICADVEKIADLQRDNAPTVAFDGYLWSLQTIPYSPSTEKVLQGIKDKISALMKMNIDHQSSKDLEWMKTRLREAKIDKIDVESIIKRSEWKIE